MTGAGLSTRRDLLAAAAGTGAALLVPTAASAATVAPPVPHTDAGWLERLMGVELLALYSYDRVLAGPIDRGSVRAVVTRLRGQERAHVTALRGAVDRHGGRAPGPPASLAEANRDLARRQVSGRLGQLRGSGDALNLLLAVERVAVGAYYVALMNLSDGSLARLLAAMMANDAQHEALLHEQLHPGDIAGAIPYGTVQGVQ